jgi:hypothetical protein
VQSMASWAAKLGGCGKFLLRLVPVSNGRERQIILELRYVILRIM